MIGLEHTKIAEVVASEISKKELNGFNEIKAENSLGKDICDSFWSQLFNSKIDSNKISENIEKIGAELYYSNIEVIDNRKKYMDDNGNVYRIENSLIPNNNYELNGYTYTTDAEGRIASVEGVLHMKDREGRLPIRDSIEDIGKGDQKEGDDRGHLIGDQFDGSNGLENIIPQDADINRRDFKNFENALAEKVKDGETVKVKIETIYEGASHRPTDILVTYSINVVEDMRIFPNKKEN